MEILLTFWSKWIFKLYNWFHRLSVVVVIVVVSNRNDWEFHFHEVTLIGCCVYTYTWLVPCLLWALLWWRGNRLRYTLLQLLAIYGYSIGIFIPLMVCFCTFFNMVNSHFFYHI